MTDAQLPPFQFDADATYYSLLRSLDFRTEDTDMVSRRLFYADCEEWLLQNLRALGAPEKSVESEWRRLRLTVRILEKDIRAGLDVMAADYIPSEAFPHLPRYLTTPAEEALPEPPPPTEAPYTPPIAEVAAPTPEPSTPEPTPAQTPIKVSAAEQDLQRLRDGLDYLSATARANAPGPLRMVRAILIYQFHQMAGESRIAILWMMLQPAMLLALIGSVYFILGTHTVLNMDVPTFSLLGAGIWIMCRQVIFRVSIQMAHHRILINFPGVSMLMQAVTQGIMYGLLYVASLSLLVSVGRQFGVFSLPDQPLVLIAYFVGMWLFALSLGLFFGGISIFWPYFMRLAPVIERALQIFSSVFLVSEQLPEAYRPWLLWSPTAHGMQLLRAGYFSGYTSTDASPAYFWGMIAVLLLAALCFERLVRPYGKPL